MIVQIWLSENISTVYDENLKRLFAGQYIQIGNTVENSRRMMRLVIDSNTIDNVLNVFKMYGKNPGVIGVQNINGSDFDLVKYPKDVREYNRFMAANNSFNNGLQIIPAADNCAMGWANFQF